MKGLHKLEGSIDPHLMKNSKIVCIGIGGSNQICESLARSNIGQLICIDFDTIDETNIVTQGYYITEYGHKKVDALEKRIKMINPEINYVGIDQNLLDITETHLSEIFTDTDLLLMMTDDFRAQAFGNKIAIKYNIPSIFAMMYEKARCSEVFFWIPNLTPGCFRCAVSPRYKAYNEMDYENDIEAQSFTIFHVTYLNSIIGLLCLAILHRDSDNLEFSNWFGDYWDKNFIQIRMHPNYSMEKENLFYKTFSNTESIFNFDTIWQEIEKECPPNYDYFCPDCSSAKDKVCGVYT